MDEKIYKTIEAILFIENAPVYADKIKGITGLEKKEIDEYITFLNDNYRQVNSSFEIIRIENAYQIVLTREVNSEVSKYYDVSKKKKLSKATLEVLAIIAYNQPITRAEVEEVRGVNSDQYFKFLLEDGFLEECGIKDAPGKPILFRTTKKFLFHFGLSTLRELPKIEDVKDYEFLREE
ncbi:SMC-Scp complex subunit ScpB [Spirochaetota bacterium]